jgi:hypothetical protein
VSVGYPGGYFAIKIYFDHKGREGSSQS